MARTRAQERSLSGFIGAYGGLPAAPANTVAPSITGIATVGSTLTGADGTWTGREPPVLTRQWRRNGADIPGATGTTYVLVAADQTTIITLAVTGRNWAGTATAVSAGTAAVT